MRARRNLPVILADAAHLARCGQIGERHDRVIPHAAFEDVPEHDDRPPGSGKGQTEPAAFAGIVGRKLRFGIGGAAVPGRCEEQPCPFVFLPGLLRRYPVALVEPGRKHRSIRIEADRLKALTLIAGRDRLWRLEAAAVIGRSRREHLAVEGLVPEGRECQRDTAAAADRDLGSRIRAPIEVEFFFGDLNRRREVLAGIFRTGDGNLSARHPDQP